MRKTHVKVDFLDALMRENNLGDAALADKLAMARTTVFRARNGNPVGAQFIAALLTAFPGKRFEDLFFMSDVLRGRNTTKASGLRIKDGDLHP